MTLETQSNSFILHAEFQLRERQRIETDGTFVSFVQLARKRREKRKNRKDVFIVNSENCTEKTERWESPITKGIVAETEAEN